MSLSKDKKVAELGLSPTESVGLDKAVTELRNSLGPIDAYTAIYSKTGINGPTLIFGKKVPGRKGHPFLALGKIQDRYVIGFSMGRKEDKDIIQKLTRNSTWKKVRTKEIFPLEDIASNSSPFASRMQEIGLKLKKQHPDLYDRRISGQSRMPSSYTQAETVMPSESQTLKDIKEIEKDESLSPTVRKQLIDARVGQGKFRKNVLKAWGGCCAVTGCNVDELLRASHVQPWAYSPDRGPRLDSENGLPLVTMLDALFDSGHMTFDEDGRAHFAEAGLEERLKSLSLIPHDIRLRQMPSERMKHYLRIHHKEVFKLRSPPININN